MLDAQPESLENKKEKLEVYLMMIAPLMYLSYPEGSLEILQNGERLAQELGDEESLVQDSCWFECILYIYRQPIPRSGIR